MKGFYCSMLLSLLALLNSENAFGQTDGDYRSRQSGDWSAASTWEVFDGGVWVNLESSLSYSNVIPSNVSGLISVKANTTVTISTSITADELTIEGAGKLIISPIGELILMDGNGIDLNIKPQETIFYEDESSITIPAGKCLIQRGGPSVAGVFENQGQVSNAVVNNLEFDGIYEHNQGSGSIVTARWNDNSVTKIIGDVSGPITGINQTFYDFIWNPTSQVNSRTLITSTNPGLTTINHNFEIHNTDASNNGQAVFFTGASAENTTVIKGDLIITGDSKFYVSALTNTSITVEGSLRISSTIDGPSLVITQTATSPRFAVKGNVDITGNSDIELAESNGGIGTLQIEGDLNFGSGLIQSTSTTTSSAVIFAKNSMVLQQNLSRNSVSPGGFQGKINYTIDLNSHTNLGEIPLTGDGILTINGKLGVGSTHTSGAIQSSGTAGNIQMPLANRVYGTASTIIYNGTGPQFIGDAFPFNVNLEIANVSGVTNDNIGVTNVVANLTLTSGALNIGNTNTLNIQKGFIVGGGTIGGSPDSNLIFSGDGVLGTLSFATGKQIVNNLTVSRATELRLGTDLTVFGAITLTGGDLNFSAFTLNMSGTSISGGKGLKSTTAGSTLIFSGSDFSGSVPFAGTGNQVDDLTFETNEGSYSWNNGLTVNNTLTLSLGTLNHTSGLTMGDNATFIKEGDFAVSSLVGNPLSASSSYNVVYTGSGNTGVELPTSTMALGDLTIESGGTVTLTEGSITVNGDLSLLGGTFSVGSNNIIMKGDRWISSGGSLLPGTGTVTFDGSTTINGTTPLSFATINVNPERTLNLGPVSGPASQIYFGSTINNHGTINGGSSQAHFNGTTTINHAEGALLFGSFNNVRIQGTLILNTVDVAPTIDNDLEQLIVSGNWNSTGGTFTPNFSIVTFSGTNQELNTGGNSFYSVNTSGSVTLRGALTLQNDLVISTGGSLNSNNFQIALAGDFIYDGTFQSQQGTVLFNGGLIQTISRTAPAANLTFFNLEVNKTGSGFFITTPVVIQNFFSVNSGTTVAVDNEKLTLRSTASRTARVTTLHPLAVINGRVIVERYMPNIAGTANYHYMAAPVLSTNVSDWASEASIGPVYYYDETFTTGGISQEARYRLLSSGSTLGNGNGYSVYIKNNSAITVDARGTLAQGARTVNVTAQSAGGNDGWNLIGNPYPSTIDWDNVGLPAGVNNAIYMTDNFNNSGQGTLSTVSYVGGVGSPLTYTGRIAQGQAFWVRATSNATITFQENDKITDGATFYREQTIPNVLRISLSGSSAHDETVIRIHEEATDYFDGQYDAYKFPGRGLKVSTLTPDNNKLVINSIGSLNCGKNIPLVIDEITSGAYSFNFAGFETFNIDDEIFLLDKVENVTVNMRDEPSYLFTINAADTLTVTGRFFIFTGSLSIRTDLALNASDICVDNTHALVTIQNPEVGVQYAIQNGAQVSEYGISSAGNTLTLSVPVNMLNVGENKVSVLAKASSDCAPVLLNTQPIIKVHSKGIVSRTESTTVCKAGISILKAEGASPDGWYHWYDAINDSFPIQGQQNSIFETPVLNKSKTYFVSAVNALGCEGERVEVKANVVQFEDAMISVDGLVLTSNHSVGNLWFFNDELIDGATSQSLEAVQSGTYSLVVDIGGCTTTATREMIVTSIEEGLNSPISVYPNPATDKLIVRFSHSNVSGIKLLTATGVEKDLRNITSSEEGTFQAEFDIRSYPSGVYFIQFQDGKQSTVKKFFITR